MRQTYQHASQPHFNMHITRPSAKFFASNTRIWYAAIKTAGGVASQCFIICQSAVATNTTDKEPSLHYTKQEQCLFRHTAALSRPYKDTTGAILCAGH